MYIHMYKLKKSSRKRDGAGKTKTILLTAASHANLRGDSTSCRLNNAVGTEYKRNDNCTRKKLKKQNNIKINNNEK